MTQITISNLSLTIALIVAILGLIGTIFAVYLYFRNPQIKTDQETISLKKDVTDLQKEMKDVKETQLKDLQGEIKVLNTNVNTLNVTVAKLTTIIDERIPKATTNI